MKTKLIVFTFLFSLSCFLLVLASCKNNSVENKKKDKSDNNNESVIVSEPYIDEIIEHLDKKYEEKIYSDFSDEVDIDENKEEEKEEEKKQSDFQYSLPIEGIQKYEKVSSINVREISQYTMNTLNIQFIGFSNDSKYLVYELNREFFVMDLYEDTFENSIIYKSTSKEAAKGYVEGEIQDLWSYDLSINEYVKNNMFWFIVDKFATQGKKGFYIAMYSADSDVRFSIFSSRIDNIDQMGNISEVDIYLSPDKGWAVLHPFFDEYNYDYGFIIVNIRENYSKILKKEAINKYNEGDYKTSLTKYRQSLYLSKGTPETYYNCAVLLKSLNKKESEFLPFVKKAILLNSNLIPRAKKDGFIE